MVNTFVCAYTYTVYIQMRFLANIIYVSHTLYTSRYLTANDNKQLITSVYQYYIVVNSYKDESHTLCIICCKLLCVVHRCVFVCRWAQ